MSRTVYITGLGPVSGLGIGMAPTWEAVRAGRSAIGPITAFDASGFACRVAAEVPGYKIGDHVPKHYRKATKVMARDIELAVIAADQAARDAGLVTRGTDPDAAKNEATFHPTYAPARVACHIGSGLIAADIDELTAALVEARVDPAAGDDPPGFDIRQWGSVGMTKLTPLWLLKYLPNMLACHVTIIHDTQGPSNTITCGEASSGLSIGENLRTIQRGAADVGFCGGSESRLNPMAYLRQEMLGRLVADRNDAPHRAVRPFDEGARGTALGEGGGIVVLEAADTFATRAGDRRAYAEVAGFGAAQNVHRESRNLKPDPHGRGTASAIRAAMREAGIGPADVDMIVPFGSGLPDYDRAELVALRAVFGDRVSQVPLVSIKPFAGNCGAGAGGLDVAIAAKALAEQTVPPILNRDTPLDGVGRTAPEAEPRELRNVLTFSTAFSGQVNALVLRRVE